MKQLVHKLLAGMALVTFMSSTVAADYSGEVGLGTEGISLAVSGATEWSLVSGDHIQWRIALGQGKADDIDDIELSDIDYEMDMDNHSLRMGLEWYPFSSNRFVDRVFFSAGLQYFDNEFDGLSETGQQVNVGGKSVTLNDDLRLQTKIQHDSIAPYLSVGWGNKLDGRAGLSFRAELGLVTPFNDPDVEVSKTGNSTGLSQEDIARERSDIEDDLDGPMAVATVGIAYHF